MKTFVVTHVYSFLFTFVDCIHSGLLRDAHLLMLMLSDSTSRLRYNVLAAQS